MREWIISAACFLWGTIRKGWEFFILLFFDVTGVFQEYIKPHLPRALQDVKVPALVFWMLAIGGILWAAVTTYHKARVKKIFQSAVDKLAELRSEGISSLYAVKLKDNDAFERWKKNKQDWEMRLLNHLKNNFQKSDYLYVSELGSMVAMHDSNAFNDEHDIQLLYLSKRFERIEQLLNSYRAQ